MRKLLKSLFVLFLLVTTTLAGGLYYLGQKFNPEFVKGLIVENSDKTLPKTKLTIESIHYDLGKEFTLQIKGLNLVEKNNQAKLINFNDLKVKIPFMAIIKEGGVIEISSDSPNIYVKQEGEEFNWLRILPKSKEKVVKQERNSEEFEIPVEVMERIKKTKVDLKIKDLGLDLNMGIGKESKLKVSKILLKEVQLGTPLVFEVASSINHQLDAQKTLKTNIETKGSVDLPKFLKNSLVDLAIDFNITKSSLTGLPYKIPNLKGNIKLTGSEKDFDIKLNTSMDNLTTLDSSVKVKGKNITVDNLDMAITLGELKKYVGAKLNSQLKGFNLNGAAFKLNVSGSTTLTEDGPDVDLSLKTSLDDFLNLSSNIKFNKTNLDVSGLDIKIALNKVKKYIGKDLKSSLKILNLNNSSFNLKGDVGVNLEPFSLKPTLSFSNTGDITVKPNNDISAGVNFNGSFDNNNLNMNVNSKVFGGSVKTNIKTYLDPMNIKTDLAQLSPINLDVKLANFKVSKSLIQKTLYSKSKEKTPEKEVVDNTPGTKIFLPDVKVNITGNKIYIDKKQLSMKGKIIAKGNNIRTDGMRFYYGKGYLSTKFNSTIKDTKNIDSKLNIFFDRVKVDAFNAFFPPYIKDIKGKFKGKIKGSLNLAKKTKYNLKLQLKGYGGEMKGFNIAKIVGPMLNDIKLLKGKVPKTYNISDRFESLNVNVTASDKLVSIKKFSLVGNKKASRATAKGKLSMGKGKSDITGTVYIKQVAKEIRKHTRKKSIPYRLAGVGFGVKPDLGYTLKKLGQSVLRAQKQKVKKAIKKEVKKFKKNVKKEIARGKKKLKKNISREKKKIKRNIAKEKKKAQKKAKDFLKSKVKIKGIKF